MVRGKKGQWRFFDFDVTAGECCFVLQKNPCRFMPFHFQHILAADETKSFDFAKLDLDLSVKNISLLLLNS